MASEQHGRVVFDERAYPVVVIRMPPRAPVESIHAWYDEVEQRLRDARSPLALVHDLRPLELSSVTALHRHAVAERTSRLFAEPFASKLGADGRIFGSAIVAAAVTGVSWLTGKTPWPQGNFDDEVRAIAWARSALGLGEADRSGSPPR